MYPSMPDNLVVMKLLDVVRNYNYFEVGEHCFRQTGGTSIGKKHAPSVACLGAGKLEEENIFTAFIFKENVLNDKKSVDDKDRFNDDMVAAFLGTEEEAGDFVAWIKPTNHQIFLHYQSNHPKHARCCKKLQLF